jgi:hypothetical protein
MLIKPEVKEKVGFLDSKFFILHEDDDYCIRARKAGYKVCVTFKSIIWHKGSTSIIKRQNYKGSLFAIYYGTRNWLLLVRKYFGVKVFSKNLFAHITKILPITIFKKRTFSFQIISAYLYAYYDAITLRNKERFLVV